MKLKRTGTSHYVGPNDVRTLTTVNLELEGADYIAQVRVELHCNNDVRAFGNRFYSVAEIDGAIELLKEAKKLMKLNVNKAAKLGGE